MANNVLPPDIDEIIGSEEWNSFTPDQRNTLVDDWALQARNAQDWSPDEIKELDTAVDSFRERSLESFGEQAGRIVKEGAIGGVKSLAALPLAVPKLGLQSGKVIGMAADPNVTPAMMAREAPEIGKMATSTEQTIQGLDTLARQYNPFSGADEDWEGEFDSLRKDVLDRNLPEEPEKLYDYLKKKAFTIAQKNAKFYGGDPMEYMPQEFQGGNDEEVFKKYFNQALTGKRPEGFIEFRDDTVPQQGLVTKNQSRSLITSPENLGLLMKFSATRNPMYFEALKQRLGRSRDRQVTDAIAEQLEDQRGEGDFFDDAAQTIFSAGGYAPEAGEAMKEEVRGLASSPVDIATTLFSFGLGKQAVKQAIQKNLLGTAGSVAKGAATEFAEGALSSVGDQAIPSLGNLAEAGAMEAVGGGVMQAAGAGVGGVQEAIARSQIPVEEQVTEELGGGTVFEPEAAQPESAPLLSPEEQAEIALPPEVEAEVEEVVADADAVEPVAPATAEALREEADEIAAEAVLPVEEEMIEEAPVAEVAQPGVVDGVIPPEEAALPPESTEAQLVDGQIPQQPAVPAQIPTQNAQGTVIDPATGQPTPVDAITAETQSVAPVGTVPQGSAPADAQVRDLTQPDLLSQQETRLPFTEADPVGRLAADIQQAEQAEVDSAEKSKLTAFSQQLPQILQRYQDLFRGVVFMGLNQGGGVQTGSLTDTLRIDPRRVLDNIRTSPTVEDSVSAFEAMMDEEFRHRVSLELDRTSPEFAKDLQAAWDNLPEEVRNASAELYFRQTGARFTDTWEAKHEFFRQYWQDADFRTLTESALRGTKGVEFLQRLIDSFLKALKSLREGADANLKPILDRLIAQATQRANELRTAAGQEVMVVQAWAPVAGEAIPPKPEQPAQTAPKVDKVPEAASPKQQAKKGTEQQASEDEEVISLKRATADRQAKERGIEPLPTQESQGWSESEREAAEIIRKDPLAGRKLTVSLKENPRAISQTESAVLLFYKAELTNDVDRAMEAVEEAQKTGQEDKVGEAMAAYADVFAMYQDAYAAGRLKGSEAGRSLNAQKMETALERKDISVAALTLKYQTEVKNGEALTREELAAIKKHADAQNAAMTKTEKAQQAEADLEGEPAQQKVVQEAKAEGKKARAELLPGTKANTKKRVKSKVDRSREWMKEHGEEGLSAPSAIEEGLSAPSALNPRAEAMATIGMEYIENGATTLPKYTEALVKEFGESVRPQAEALFSRSKEILKETEAEVKADEKKIREAADPKKVLEKEKERLEGKPSDGLDRDMVVALFKAHVKADPSISAEKLNTAVTKDVQTIYPNATESDVRVAITDYGKAKWPTKDALKKREAEYRRLLRLIESLERIQAGKAALKSGLQREKMSPRERELTAQIKEAMKKFQVETTAENQLASTKKAAANRLKNQIEDLNRVIEGKQKPREARQQLQYDAELNALVKERDELKAFVDNLTGPSPLGKWNKAAQTAAIASAENYRRKIAQKDFAARQKPNYDPTEATRKLQEEAAAAKAEFQTLKDLSGETQKEQLEAQRGQLERKVKELKEQIQTGQKPPAGKPKMKFSELDALKQEMKALQGTIRILDGKDSESKRAANAEKALAKVIEKMDADIKRRESFDSPKNVTLPSERRAPVENEKLKEMRQNRAELKEILDAFKEAETPRRLPEEIARDNFKRRVAKLQYEAENGIKKSEFLELPPKYQQDDLQKRSIDAQVDLALERKKWLDYMFNEKLKKRVKYERFKDTLGEVLGTMRAVMTGGEFSAILRQGKYAFGHPVVFAKSLPAVWKAFRSEEGLLRIQKEIESRDNYKNGAYKKLALVDPYAASLTKMEEDFQSRWANKIPLIAGTARSYSAFLNLLRANSFDVIAASHTGDLRPLMRSEADSLAETVNTLTGRGSLGKFEQAGPFLNRLLFSPKFLASRLNMLTLRGVVWDVNPLTRKTIAKEYARAYASQIVLMGLYAMFMKSDDDEIELDWRSSDFLKIPIGPNTKIDPAAGMLQLLALSARIWTGETKGRDDEISPLRGEDVGFADRNMQDVLFDFQRSKLAPIPSFLLSMVLQKGYGGQEFSVLPTEASLQAYLDSEVGKALTPMTWKEIYEASQDLGMARAPTAALLLLMGENIQSFPEKDQRSR